MIFITAKISKFFQFTNQVSISLYILMDFQNNLGRCCIDVIFSIQWCSLRIFIALIGGVQSMAARQPMVSV